MHSQNLRRKEIAQLDVPNLRLSVVLWRFGQAGSRAALELLALQNPWQSARLCMEAGHWIEIEPPLITQRQDQLREARFQQEFYVKLPFQALIAKVPSS